MDRLRSQDCTPPLLDLLDLDTLRVGTGFIAVFFGLNGSVNGLVENFVDAL